MKWLYIFLAVVAFFIAVYLVSQGKNMEGVGVLVGYIILVFIARLIEKFVEKTK